MIILIKKQAEVIVSLNLSRKIKPGIKIKKRRVLANNGGGVKPLDKNNRISSFRDGPLNINLLK